MCGGPGIFCCFRLCWSALCYVRGYCYKLGLSMFFFFFVFVVFFFFFFFFFWGGGVFFLWFCFFFFFFFLFRGGACFIEREVVVGGGFRASWTPRLEWLAWPLAWLREFVGLCRWLP